MKTYILDRLIVIFIAIFIIMFVFTPELFNPIFVTVIRLTVIIAFGYACKEVLLLPLDYIIGPVKRECVFSGCIWTRKLHAIASRVFCVWEFYDNNERIIVVAPVSCFEYEVASKLPPDNTKLIITYYRYSRLLKSWEIDMND